ncbi:MAG: hypothetical protein GC131_07605 [Alphaproteobacteria bacterium]|nr:hypothetical protein [Alphaproteobacteria bacterium]
MTYAEMAKKFGKLMAIDILMTIEKMARVQMDEVRVVMTEEQRLTTALAALDRISPVKPEEYERTLQDVGG